MTGLLTDLYELTMAAGYFEAGKATQKATFELSIRRLPRHRNFIIAAGLAQCVEFLLNLRFTARPAARLRQNLGAETSLPATIQNAAKVRTVTPRV